MLRQVGRYNLVRSLGRGGMGDVWLAELEESDKSIRRVALKLVPHGLQEDSSLQRRLEREARIVRRLTHPNIVSLYDFGRDMESEVFYLAMEFVDGLDGKELLSQMRLRGMLGLSFPLVLYFVRECLAALAYAHGLVDEGGRSLELVHRDVSPSNILFSCNGCIKITDFGIAKSRNLSAATAEDFFVGKIPYMSPEQVDDLDLDNRSDLWSLGVVIYEMATGLRLFAGRTPVERMAQILGAEIPPIEERRQEFPGWFSGFLRGFLQRDPAARFGNASEALKTLMEKGEGGLRGAQDELARLILQFKSDEEAIPMENITRSNRVSTSAPAVIPDSSDGYRVEETHSLSEEFEAQPVCLHEDDCSPGGVEMHRDMESTPLAIPGAKQSYRENTLPRWKAPLSAMSDGGSQDAICSEGWKETRSPYIGEMGLWRFAKPFRVGSQDAGAEDGEQSVWLREIPASVFFSDELFEMYLEQTEWLRNPSRGNTSGFLARHAAVYGKIVFGLPGMFGDERCDNSKTGYQVIRETRAMPLQEFMDYAITGYVYEQIQELERSGRKAGDTSEVFRWLTMRLRLELGVEIVRQLLSAMDELHSSGRWHGALTPESLLVEPVYLSAVPSEVKIICWRERYASCSEVRPFLKMTDWALRESFLAEAGKMLERYGLKIESGKLKGDLSGLDPENIEHAFKLAAHPLFLYGAPETVSAKEPAGPGCDLYFAGVLLYRLLTGRHPFKERSSFAALSKMLDPGFEPLKVERLNPLVGGLLSDFVRRAVSVEPGERFPDSRAMRVAMEDILISGETSSSSPAESSAPDEIGRVEFSPPGIKQEMTRDGERDAGKSESEKKPGSRFERELHDQ